MISCIVLVRKNRLHFFCEAGFDQFDLIRIKGETSWDLNQVQPKKQVVRALEACEASIGQDCRYVVIWWDGQETIWKQLIRDSMRDRRSVFVPFGEVMAQLAERVRKDDSVSRVGLSVDGERFDVRWTDDDGGQSFDFHAVPPSSAATTAFEFALHKMLQIVFSRVDADGFSDSETPGRISKRSGARPAKPEKTSSKKKTASTGAPGPKAATRSEDVPPPKKSGKSSRRPGEDATRGGFSISVRFGDRQVEKMLVPVPANRTLMVGRSSKTYGKPEIDVVELLRDSDLSKEYSRRELEIYSAENRVTVNPVGKNPSRFQCQGQAEMKPLNAPVSLADGDLIDLGNGILLIVCRG